MGNLPDSSAKPVREIWRWIARLIAAIPLVLVACWTISLYIPFGRQCLDTPDSPAIPIFDTSPLWTPFAYLLWRLRRSAGKLAPRWVPVLIYVVLLVLVAIAIPSNWRSVRVANQHAAVYLLRTLNTAESTYADTYRTGFSPSLAALGQQTSQEPASASAAGLIDRDLSSGKKRGYTFVYTPGPTDSTGHIKSYTVAARPLDGSCGNESYFTDNSGAIRHTTQDRPATTKDAQIADFP